jgi:hypothetical protein
MQVFLLWNLDVDAKGILIILSPPLGYVWYYKRHSSVQYQTELKIQINWPPREFPTKLNVLTNQVHGEESFLTS